MKRKDMARTVDAAVQETFAAKGTMVLLDRRNGAEIEVDMDSVLPVVRGVLAWVRKMLDGAVEPVPRGGKALQGILVSVGSSIALDLSDDDRWRARGDRPGR